MGGGGVLAVMRARRRMVSDPRIPTTPARSTPWRVSFHRTGRPCFFPGLFAGHDPTRGSGSEGLLNLADRGGSGPVESGWVRMCTKSDGSGQVYWPDPTREA